MEKYTEVFYWGSDSNGEFGVGEKSIGKIYKSPHCCSFSVQIKMIACGDDHSGFIASNGYLYMMGSNQYGKLGVSNLIQQNASRPVLVECLTDFEVSEISCGLNHTGIVTSNGLVFTWGQGSYGQLGIGEVDLSPQPVQLELPSAALAISCGGRHTAVILANSNRNLAIWGSGDTGQLGTGSREFAKTPLILNLNNIKQVCCGNSHTLVLTESNEILATGSNIFGQLGIGSKENSNIFLKIPSLKSKSIAKIAANNFSACLTAEGDIFIWGDSFLDARGNLERCLPRRIEAPNKFVDINLGSEFVIACDRNGLLYSWGSGSNGCLGSASFEKNITFRPLNELQTKSVRQVACGSNFVIALGVDMDKFRNTEKSKSTKDNQELLLCLEEMRKEISRLQKGTGGLEDLNCKLEQSKIKQRHLQSLFMEEQAQRSSIEAILKESNNEKELSYKKIDEMSQTIQQLTSQNKELEKSLHAKINELDETHKKLQEIMMKNKDLESELEQIPLMLKTVKDLELKLQGSEDEKSGVNGKIIKSLEENTKLMVKNQKLQEEISVKTKEIFELSKKCESLGMEKARNAELQQQNYQLNKKITDIETELVKKTEYFTENINYLRKEVENLTRVGKEKDDFIEKLKHELQYITSNLEHSTTDKSKLEKKLSEQKKINKDIINSIQRELSTRAENMKQYSIPPKKGFSSTYGQNFDTFRKTG